MKKLSKIKLRSTESILNENEMKKIIGGYDGGVAEGCNDHDKDACFGECAEIIAGKLKSGKCEWVILPMISYAGCACVIGDGYYS